MTPRLTEAKYVRDYILHLRFADGTEGDVDSDKSLKVKCLNRSRILSSFKRLPSAPTSTR